MTPQKSIAGIVDAKLQLSTGFAVNCSLLARLLHGVCQDQRSRIPQADLAERMGLARRHVEHLASIAYAFGLIQRGTYRPTSLGRLLHSKDPFFDNVGTLWFLHYFIASDPRYLIWNRMVTEVIPQKRSFTREQARQAFESLRLYVSAYSYRVHIGKELRVFLNAYTEQNFLKLAYLRVVDDSYALSYREPVPPLVLAAAITCFRDRHRPGDTAVSVADLLTDRNGPGVVFQLDETSLRAALESLKLQGGFSLESRADLDQVRLSAGLPPCAWMERYYAQH